jgi:hypothetical protein
MSVGRKVLAASCAAVVLAVGAAAPAQAEFGLSQLDVRFAEANGSPTTQAGAHPFSMETFFEVNYSNVGGLFYPDGGDIKDLVLEQVKGFVGSATAVSTCSTIDFATLVSGSPSCGDDTAIGVTAALIGNPSTAFPAAVYSLEPPPGVPFRLGFVTQGLPLVVDVEVKDRPDHNVIASTPNIPQILTVLGAAIQLWGTPADPSHDFARGHCSGNGFSNDLTKVIVDGRLALSDHGGPGCSTGGSEEAFLTVPRACEGPLLTSYELDPWNDPGAWVRGSDRTPAFGGCGKLVIDPRISSQATVDSAGTSSGLDFELSFDDEGLLSPKGIAQSEMRKLVVTLPEGVTVNPSLAEGLGVCTPADLDRETLAAESGQGCPNSSKIGVLAVKTPLLEKQIEGSVFLAQQNDPETAAKENPFDSLIALYVVLKDKEQGILVKQAGKVEPDPLTGQLVSSFYDIPQVPFSDLSFQFREGQRAPLISPPACGEYETKAVFTPWARPEETLTKTATFKITRGVGGGPCPLGGIPPFAPGFEAGSLNNSAGSYSPFLMRLTRQDGEQDMTKFSALFPPGLVGKLAGVRECREAQIALAKAKSGRAELRSPSCPSDSRIGGTLAAAGVGSSLTYVPGQLYLAGPYKGSLLSVVSITPAVAGPFDVGTVVVRVALNVNPRTAQVEVDGAASDPIPHILQGIPLNVRDLRVETDRPEFTLNPTSCEESSTKATLFGSFLNLFDPADDVPVGLRSRYQAADCAALPFRPRLNLRLKGGTERGAHPAFSAFFHPRPGHANTSRLLLRFPRSAFLDQAHIRTICTRVQFAADACPKGAIYGHAVAFTPLLDEPLQGPVYLRSSDHNLPDVVIDLHGRVDFEGVARIDSIRGGIRATVEGIPDAPISKVMVRMQGGKKSLIVNSRDICAGANRANVNFMAHNAKRFAFRPQLKADCGKKK